MQTINISPEDIQFLEDSRHFHDTLIKAFYMKGISGEIKVRMQKIIGDYFQPGYSTDIWCGPCIADMVRKLYRHYDEYLKENNETTGA